MLRLPQMALLNLDKIVLQRTVIGVTCPACGGLLEAQVVKSGLVRKLMGKRARLSMRYKCQDCRKRYRLDERG